MTDKTTSATVYQLRRSEAPCPRCHETCGWCSDYRWHHGKMRLSDGKSRCTISEMHPDPVCAICGGSRRVMMTTTIQCEALAHGG